MNYQGHAFNGQFKDGKSSGEIQVSSGRISFSKNGQLYTSFPYKGLELERGGSSNRLIYFKHQDHPEWVLYSSDETILKDHNLLLNCPQYTKLLKKQKHIARFVLLGSFALFILALVGLWSLKKPIAEKVTDAIPISWEVEMGEQIFDLYAKQKLVIEDEALNEEMNLLISELIDNLAEKPYPYKFHLIVDETPNAAAFPGGNVIIHTGLFSLAETPEEILGVIGHELAHVNERHSLRSIVNGAGTIILAQFLLGDIEALSSFVLEGGVLLLLRKNSREHETEADLEGWEYLREAGINPKGLITFFEKLEAWKPEAIEGSEEAMSFLSTHPLSSERVAYLNDKLAKEDASQFREITFDLRGFKERMSEVVSKGFSKKTTSPEAAIEEDNNKTNTEEETNDEN